MQVSQSAGLRRAGLDALRGNWQAALQVTFVAGVIGIVQDALQVRIEFGLGLSLQEQATMAMRALAPYGWALSLLAILRMILAPVLTVGLMAYFLALHRRMEPSFSTLFSRMYIFIRCFCLYIVMAVFTFLWSLLLLIPGIIAIYRYAMAPYLLADDPEMGVMEAISRSKQMMDGHKMRLFVLQISFIGWVLLCLVAVSFLYSILGIIGTALGLFASLALQVYMHSATTAFYLELAGR